MKTAEIDCREYPVDDDSIIHTNLSTYCSELEIYSFPLCEYLEDLSGDERTQLLVRPDDIRKRTNFTFDVVQSTSKKCSTFTKAYGSHHFFGSGSFLQTEKLDDVYNGTFSNEDLIRCVPRFFSPTEIAKLHFFPVGKGFSFPEDITLKQKWRLLGNSLNVKVVQIILQNLLKW